MVRSAGLNSRMRAAWLTRTDPCIGYACVGDVAGEVDRDSSDLAALGSLRNIDRILRLRQRLSGLH